MKPAIQLHDNETLLYETQPKRALIAYTILTWIFAVVVVIAAIYVQSHYLQGSMPHIPPSYELVFIALFIIILALAYYWLNSALQKHWYFITNQSCINFSGFWGINKRVILFSSIVDVNIRQNPLQTLLGISSVIIDAPVTGSRGSIEIAGLSAESAEKISHLIGEQMRNNGHQKVT